MILTVPAFQLQSWLQRLHQWSERHVLLRKTDPYTTKQNPQVPSSVSPSNRLCLKRWRIINRILYFSSTLKGLVLTSGLIKLARAPPTVIHKVLQTTLSKLVFILASLVVQWLGIHPAMLGTPIWSLVREYPTCHEVTRPVHHNCWACVLEPRGHNHQAHMPRACAPQQEKPQQWAVTHHN